MVDWTRRIATILVCAPLALQCLRSDTFSYILLLFLQTVSLWEYENHICKAIQKNMKIPRRPIDTFLLPILGIFIIHMAWLHVLTFAMSLFVSFVVILGMHFSPFLQASEKITPNSIIRLGLSVFGLCPIITGFSHAVLMRHDAIYGQSLQILTCLLMWNTDNGAILLGSFYGKHLLIPSISPNKTVEGVVGGIVLCIVTTFILWHVPDYCPLPPLSTTGCFVFGAVVALLGVLGDLIESYFKRLANLKDSGFFFPGHGGVLDRMDSMLLIAPFIYYCHEFNNLLKWY